MLIRRCLIAFTVCIAVASCAVTPRAIEGKVINHLDGSPVADAFVIANWTYVGSDGFGSRSGCSGIEIVKSDEWGRYVIPARWGGEPDQLMAYKPRFTTYYPARQNIVMTQEDLAKYLVLKEVVPYSGPIDEQQPNRNWLWYMIACERGDLRARFGALYQALDDEAASLGVKGYYMTRLKEIEAYQRDEAKRRSATSK